MREWSKRNRDKIKGYDNKESRRRANRATTLRKYGLTASEYDDMMAEQGDLCAICGNPETCLGNNGEVKMLAVDHNHDTGEVRGLLCNNCNRAIGLLGDDPQLLLKAVAYLKH